MREKGAKLFICVKMLWGGTVPVTETWVSNSAVESGGMGWRGGVVDGGGVVGASGEHI